METSPAGGETGAITGADIAAPDRGLDLGACACRPAAACGFACLARGGLMACFGGTLLAGLGAAFAVDFASAREPGEPTAACTE